MDQQIAQIVSITGCTPEIAKFHLESANGDIQKAISTILEIELPESTPQNIASSSKAAKGSTKPRGFASLADYATQESSDDEQHQNYFAGGEKSGVLMQGPKKEKDDIIKSIMEKAAKGGSEQESSEGGQERLMTFYANGFTVEDTFYSYEDPKNKQYLEAINQGHAPRELLGVKYGEDVKVKVQHKMHEDYVEQFKAFKGQGYTLGSTGSDTTSTSGSIPGSYPTTSSAQPAQVAQFSIDPTKPTTSVQIRLADGTRLVSQFNTLHTIQDIRNFINNSKPGESSRRYALMTTFPNKELKEGSLEENGLKGAVIVQKYL